MSGPLYKIRDLQCSYDQKKVVLHIPHLDLEKGKLFFIIGSSGIGKSTLLETLGMMNRPVKRGEGSIEYLSDGRHINLLDLWNGNDADISRFRMQNFSFIFQNTNLMPYFTAGENMCYTLLMENHDWEDSSRQVKDLMALLGLEEDLFSRPVQQLSGGQRQRLAFVRAFVSSFEALFGDEPTGNLDPHTAATLMQVLRNFIIEKKKTAVIVSHDIPLAERFADEIFCITRAEGASFGVLDNRQRYIRTTGGWMRDGKLLNASIEQELRKHI